jgi:hypothetical protein
MSSIFNPLPVLRVLGTCSCLNSLAYAKQTYRAISSDGKGSTGSRGDCGYIETKPDACVVGGRDVCSGHGACSNSTGSAEFIYMPLVYMFGHLNCCTRCL